jgi:hypothetical protein
MVKQTWGALKFFTAFGLDGMASLTTIYVATAGGWIGMLLTGTTIFMGS